VICIDPGVKACGLAKFVGDRLVYTCYAPREDIRTCNPWLDELIIEMPRIYPGSGQQKGDLNDLLDLAAVVGFLEGVLGGRTTRVFPAQWKGQVPKKIMTARILGKLSVEERNTIVSAGSKTHNIVDAIGIGLWKLGRL
jgi:hypothetical protein